MTKTFMYLVGYSRDFMELTNSGWGCGYVAIPLSHKLAQRYNADELYREECGLEKSYLQIGNEEITYTEWKEIDGETFLVIGFDTAHSYNNPDNDFNWVFKKTLELKALMDKEE